MAGVWVGRQPIAVSDFAIYAQSQRCSRLASEADSPGILGQRIESLADHRKQELLPERSGWRRRATQTSFLLVGHLEKGRLTARLGPPR